eukprot:CAMPEP_0182443800 /NCGR_PEP_ID=MMETSP1172-20130603/2429_1 /TAXON_ID=708627 /ORGANISM="Timspurckia oligopyrenoides, Strain CCMP3278" /LENGTH=240 /DNA_ID=CAMNT_0024639179 /DNA_START=66 /DNA_END=788 /DNA_ORIENTATION=-
MDLGSGFVSGYHLIGKFNVYANDRFQYAGRFLCRNMGEMQQVLYAKNQMSRQRNGKYNDVRNKIISCSSKSDETASRPNVDVGDARKQVQQKVNPTRESGTFVVAVERPLGIVVEETQSGLLFISELIPEGNALRTNQIQQGDVIVAASGPYGNGLVTLGSEDPSDLLATIIETREEGAPIYLEIERLDGGLDALLEIIEKENARISWERMDEIVSISESIPPKFIPLSDSDYETDEAEN